MAKNNYKNTDKKEQFIRKEKSKLPYIIAAILLIVLITVGSIALSGKPDNKSADLPFGDPVATPRSYIGRAVSMTKVEPQLNEVYASIPLETLEANDIVYFEVANNNGFLVPLMAYITPSGRIFTGSSMCEPCQGRYFSLAGETLVCDTCRTTYTIDSHEFLSGSRDCGSYPPVYMEPIIGDGMINLPLDKILQWESRVY